MSPNLVDPCSRHGQINNDIVGGLDSREEDGEPEEVKKVMNVLLVNVLGEENDCQE